MEEAERFVHVPGLTYVKANKSYSGSHEGLRYNIRAAEGQFVACVWPDPWCFEKTAEEEKSFAEFPQSEEGLRGAEAWIEQQYSADPGRWRPKNFLDA